ALNISSQLTSNIGRYFSACQDEIHHHFILQKSYIISWKQRHHGSNREPVTGMVVEIIDLE
ncbi:MAG: hypothetical protein ACK2T3_00160, partial [Candidatus Promineifilaceae bacterium]